MKNLIATLCFLCISLTTFGQSAKTSLTAEKIKNKLYLKLDDESLRYGEEGNDADVNQKLSGTTTFASTKKSVTLYIKARNPVIDDISVDTKTIEHVGRKELRDALSTVGDYTNELIGPKVNTILGFLSDTTYTATQPFEKIFMKGFDETVEETVNLINETTPDNSTENIQSIETNIAGLKGILEASNKEKIEAGTTTITQWHNMVSIYEKNLEILKELITYHLNLKEWKTKLKSNNYYELKTVDELSRDSIQAVTVKVVKKTLKYDKDEHTVYLESEEDAKAVEATLHFEKFSRFVAEVRPAVVFTDLSFPKYGTETNDAGEQVVAKNDDETFSKINAGVMINFNYNVGDDEWVPFFQIGTGPSKKYPILFSGAGVRINDKIMVSGGAAWTWVNELSSLNIGDVVSGTAAIDEDQAFKFTTTPKFYLSLQFKL